MHHASCITHHASRIMVALGLLLPPLGAQDVFLGGGLDLEVATGPHTTFAFGRGAGINFNFALGDRAEVYYEYNLAGGQGRTLAFSVRFPRFQERQVDLSLGRIVLPFGLPGVDPTRRYVPGAPDWFDTFRHYRTGNVFLDHFGDGLRVTYQGDRWHVDAAVINAPQVRAKDTVLRLTAGDQRRHWQAGWSAFSGEIEGASYLAWFGPHLSLTLNSSSRLCLEALSGHAAAMDQRSYYAELTYHWKASQRLQKGASSPIHWTAFASWAAFDPEEGAQVSTLHCGVQRALDPFGQMELRYELRDAPGQAGENQVVVRYRADY